MTVLLTVHTYFHMHIKAHPYVISYEAGSEIISIILADSNFSLRFSLVWIFISKLLFEVSFKLKLYYDHIQSKPYCEAFRLSKV